MLPLAPIVVSRKDLSQLGDLTQDLCNFMTLLMHHVSMLPANLPAPVSERLLIITGLVTKTEDTFKDLLLVFGRLQDAANKQVKCGEKEEQKCCHKRQG